jgi:hypothetical protein
LPAGILEQAKAAASSAATTVSNAAVQAATTTQNLASQAYNSETTAQITEQAKALAGQAATATGGVLGQAGVAVHQGAHTLAPSIVPAPGVPVGGVDKSHDLEPESAADKAKLEKLFQSRPDASDLQEKGILKGEWFVWDGKWNWGSLYRPHPCSMTSYRSRYLGILLSASHMRHASF